MGRRIVNIKNFGQHGSFTFRCRERITKFFEHRRCVDGHASSEPCLDLQTVPWLADHSFSNMMIASPRVTPKRET